REAEFIADVSGRALFIARQHLHGNAGGGRGLDRRPGTCFGRIQKNSESGENQVRLVGYRCGVMTPIDNTSCYAKCTEPLRAEPVEGGLDGVARCCVERPLLTVCILVSPA